MESLKLPSCNFVATHSQCCEEQLLSPCHFPAEELTRKYNLFCHYSGEGKKNPKKNQPKPTTRKSQKQRYLGQAVLGNFGILKGPRMEIWLQSISGKLWWDEHPGKVGSILQMPFLCPHWKQWVPKTGDQAHGTQEWLPKGFQAPKQSHPSRLALLTQLNYPPWLGLFLLSSTWNVLDQTQSEHYWARLIQDTSSLKFLFFFLSPFFLRVPFSKLLTKDT